MEGDEPNVTDSYRLSKRIVDKIVAALLLVVLAPVFAVAFVASGLGGLLARPDRGPLLQRITRISAGREFDLLKFRTLRRDALEQAEDPQEAARLLERDPANLTWAGRRVLKPWYLDELPQLVNVLRGDMSLVGPRPWPPSMVSAQVAAGHDYRNRVVPGWTGPAQVEKGMVDPDEYVKLDLAYVEGCRTWSAWRLVRTDLRLLRRTLSVLARGEGLTY
jgi:lipopolysaccharide/colanic/teichoic acid biosynthesis glycosyltransferase